MTRVKAAILTIGTEVSTGQIINSNAAWIANQLTDHNIDVDYHLTVADEKKAMLDALAILGDRVQLLLVTGGLGPTRDDFTREVINEYWQDKLVFHPASWQKIEQRFAQLGLSPPASNKQQCYFPSNALVIANPEGTADAFALQRGSLTLWCLPGPPQEIKAIFQASLVSELKKLGQGQDASLLFRWHLIGKSESALGELVEATIAGSTLSSGYRPHAPYIEIKIWSKASEVAQNQAWLDRLDLALAPWCVAKDDEDSGWNFFQSLLSFEHVAIEDAGTLGAFVERIGAIWQKLPQPKPEISSLSYMMEREGKAAPPLQLERSLTLSIGALNEQGEWLISWQNQQIKREKKLCLPFKRHPKRWDRERKFVCEMSLAAFQQQMQAGEKLA